MVALCVDVDGIRRESAYFASRELSRYELQARLAIPLYLNSQLNVQQSRFSHKPNVNQASNPTRMQRGCSQSIGESRGLLACLFPASLENLCVTLWLSTLFSGRMLHSAYSLQRKTLPCRTGGEADRADRQTDRPTDRRQLLLLIRWEQIDAGCPWKTSETALCVHLGLPFAGCAFPHQVSEWRQRQCSVWPWFGANTLFASLASYRAQSSLNVTRYFLGVQLAFVTVCFSWYNRSIKCNYDL